MTTFLRVLDADADQKGTTLFEAVNGWRSGTMLDGIFQVEPSSFEQVPGSPFAYWVSEWVRGLYEQFPSLEESGAMARRTNGTTNDMRWIRAAWEVDPGRIGRHRGWARHLKGGEFSRFYSDPHLVIAWDDAVGTYPGYLGTVHRPDIRPASLQFFFRPGVTWSRRSQKGLSLRAMPGQCIFGDKGPAIFIDTDDHPTLEVVLALVNSAAFRSLADLQVAFGSFEAGILQRTPFPKPDEACQRLLARHATDAWRLKRDTDGLAQASNAFAIPALLRVDGATLASRTEAWATQTLDTEAMLAAIQHGIDDIAFQLYLIHGEDRRQMEEGFGSLGLSGEDADEESTDEDEAEEAEGADPITLTEALLEWTLGVALGRFDVRLATGERQPPLDPDPFDPLPVCSPGMLQDADGLPATAAPTGYPLGLPPHGILVDDPGHPWDVVSRMEAVVDLVAGEHAHAWIEEAETILGRDLRDWLRRYGFERHLKRYSRSRRKAPLFWHLAPKSRMYGIWLYSPAATRDTMYRILNDYVDPRRKGAERRLLELRQEAGDRPTAQQRRDLAAQQSVVEELRAFREELTRVAPLWAPHRDDGVVLNCAVLWRLFDQHRAWQKECKAKWVELAKGKYDWARWAMHLWPERVVRACASDRSIAIAHGLEDALWEEDSDGKWEPRSDVEEQVAILVGERRSAAIQAALDEFMRAT